MNTSLQSPTMPAISVPAPAAPPKKAVADFSHEIHHQTGGHGGNGATTRDGDASTHANANGSATGGGPMPGGDDASTALLARHIVDSASLQGVLYPLGARPSGYLSNLDVSVEGSSHGSAPSVSTQPIAVDQGRSPIDMLNEGSVEEAQTQRYTAAFGQPAPAEAPCDTGLDTSTSSEAASTNSPLASEWTRSYIRLAAGDEGTTAWLRDYRLDTDGIARASQALRQLSGEGQPVARVMVNGHETWRASAPNDKDTIHGG